MKPSAPVAALRPEDYDVEALVAMSDSQFATIDFSQPERPVDMSEWQLSQRVRAADKGRPYPRPRRSTRF